MLSQDDARAILLTHARHPRRQGHVENLTAFGECKNPLCGDHVRVELSLEGAILSEIRIQTQGCAISTASASLMTEMTEGRLRKDVLALIPQVHDVFLQKADADWPSDLAPLEALRHLRVTPLKVPCALIGWTALKEALNKKPGESSSLT